MGQRIVLAIVLAVIVSACEKKPGGQTVAVVNNEEITAADRLIVESPTNTGLIIIKALVAEPGYLAAARAALAAAKCQPSQSS